VQDTYVFELAVYRLPLEEWRADASHRTATYERRSLDEFAELGGTEPDEEIRRLAARFARYQERPYEWRYNEIVGWVRLLWDGPGPVIKGYLWQVGTKSLDGVRPRKRYQRGFVAFPFGGGMPMCKVLEEWFGASQSDAEIAEQLRQALVSVVEETPTLKRRHVDLDIFDTLAPHVRWRQLLGLEPPM
jgi:hypothetical protein